MCKTFNLSHIISVVISLFIPVTIVANTFNLEGMIGAKYPIVVELEQLYDGSFEGRYAYLTTLRNSGDVPCSWLSITPNPKAPYSEWFVRDCNGKVVEKWRNINFESHQILTANMTNIRGISYEVSATLSEKSSDMRSLDTYFRQHLGEYAYEFNLFDNDKIKIRLVNVMGLVNFNNLKHIYETEFPIEYQKGMYWVSGFKAHQCCDPAAVLAYDSHSNSFYVWIRKDDNNYWWSESGEIPFKFRELVNMTF